MCRVVNDAQAETASDSCNLVMVADITGVVHRDYGPGTMSQQRLDPSRVDAQRLFVNVAEYRACAGSKDRLEVGNVVERRCDDLVSGSDACEQKRKVKRRMTGAHGGDLTARRR